MKAVGIKQLKAHLSDYIRLAKCGETVLVTERAEVVAELRPARRQPLRATDVEDTLAELAEEGEIERASLPKKGWRWSVRGLGLPKGTADEIMRALREDR